MCPLRTFPVRDRRQNMGSEMMVIKEDKDKRRRERSYQGIHRNSMFGAVLKGLRLQSPSFSRKVNLYVYTY
jgi:hypothetical protein